MAVKIYDFKDLQGDFKNDFEQFLDSRQRWKIITDVTLCLVIDL